MKTKISGANCLNPRWKLVTWFHDYLSFWVVFAFSHLFDSQSELSFWEFLISNTLCSHKKAVFWRIRISWYLTKNSRQVLTFFQPHPFFLLIIAYNHIANTWTRACLCWQVQAGLSTLWLWSQSRAETLKYKAEIPATLVPSFAQRNTTAQSSVFCSSPAGRIFLTVNLQRRKSIAFQTCIAAAANHKDQSCHTNVCHILVSLPQNQLCKWHKIKMFHEISRTFFFPQLSNWFLISLFAM